jgi:hydrogenase maturation protease
MGRFIAAERSVRLLGLGNEILADDAVGILAAREVKRRFGAAIQVVESSETGFNLLDHLLGVARLLIVDAIVTGSSEPGTIHYFGEQSIEPMAAPSPHFVGVFEVLAAARRLGLAAPAHVRVVAVEASDCFTVGGDMHPAVRASIPVVSEYARWLLQ